LRMGFTPSNKVVLQALAQIPASETALGTATTVANLTYAPNTFVSFRAQVIGLNPTTINLKAWAAGTSEPSAWQYTITDSTSALQAAGALGLQSRLASAST